MIIQKLKKTLEYQVKSTFSGNVIETNIKNITL